MRFLLLLSLLVSTQLNARPIETCFSPSQQCAPKLISLISSAQHSLSIAIYNITNMQLTDAIIAVHQRGVPVKVVADRGQASFNITKLVNAGVPLKYGNQVGIMHHKFVVIDSSILETGSYNYSYAAESKNQENQVYVYDLDVIASFSNQFSQMWSEGIAP